MSTLLATIPRMPGGEPPPLPEVSTGATIVGAVTPYIIFPAMLVGIILLIVGNMKWMRAKGDKAKTDSAKGLVLIGLQILVVSIVAFFITSILYSSAM